MGPEISGEKMKKTLFFYSIFFFCFLILQRASGFLVKILLANAVTPYDYGLITMVALTIPGMLQMITNFNFFQILSHSTEGKRYFGFSVVAGVALVIIVSILLFIFNREFFAYLNIPTDKANFFLWIIIISLFLQSITMDFQGLFAGLKFYARPAILMAIPTLIRLLVIAGLMVLNIYSLEIIILVFTLSSVAPFFIFVGSEKYRKCIPLIKTIEIPSKTIFVFGLSVFFIGQLPTMLQYFTRIAISHEFGMTWTGYYDMSLTLAGLILFALGTMSFIAIPEATDSNSSSLYRKGGLGDVTRAFFCFVILFTVITFFYSDFIVTKLFSKDYIIAGQYLPILTVGFIFLFIQSFLASITLSTTKNTNEFFPLIIAGLILLPFNYFLTDILINGFRNLGYGNGFVGGYVSITLVFIIWTFITILFLKDRSPLNILFENGEKLIIVVIITSAFLFILNPEPFIGICISIGVYMSLILLSGYLNIQMFREIVLNK
jgi:O-antigen/teichoic acid export membrane protein